MATVDRRGIVSSPTDVQYGHWKALPQRGAAQNRCHTGRCGLKRCLSQKRALADTATATLCCNGESDIKNQAVGVLTRMAPGARRENSINVNHRNGMLAGYDHES